MVKRAHIICLSLLTTFPALASDGEESYSSRGSFQTRPGLFYRGARSGSAHYQGLREPLLEMPIELQPVVSDLPVVALNIDNLPRRIEGMDHFTWQQKLNKANAGDRACQLELMARDVELWNWQLEPYYEQVQKWSIFNEILTNSAVCLYYQFANLKASDEDLDKLIIPNVSPNQLKTAIQIWADQGDINALLAGAILDWNKILELKKNNATIDIQRDASNHLTLFCNLINKTNHPRGSLLSLLLLYRRSLGIAIKEKDLAMIETAAAQGFAPAQCLLGSYYLEKDQGKALKFFMAGAQQGEARSLFSAGALILRWVDHPDLPKTTEEKIRLGLSYVTRSAQFGFLHAQHYLGTQFYNGVFVTRNYPQAKFWLEKAVASGDTSAAGFLAEKFYGSNGVEKDPYLAAHYAVIANHKDQDCHIEAMYKYKPEWAQVYLGYEYKNIQPTNLNPKLGYPAELTAMLDYIACLPKSAADMQRKDCLQAPESMISMFKLIIDHTNTAKHFSDMLESQGFILPHIGLTSYPRPSNAAKNLLCIKHEVGKNEQYKEIFFDHMSLGEKNVADVSLFSQMKNPTSKYIIQNNAISSLGADILQHALDWAEVQLEHKLRRQDEASKARLFSFKASDKPVGFGDVKLCIEAITRSYDHALAKLEGVKTGLLYASQMATVPNLEKSLQVIDKAIELTKANKEYFLQINAQPLLTALEEKIFTCAELRFEAFKKDPANEAYVRALGIK